jgi:hypothetical protein
MAARDWFLPIAPVEEEPPVTDERSLLQRWFGSPEELLSWGLYGGMAFGAFGFLTRFGWRLAEKVVPLPRRMGSWLGDRLGLGSNVTVETGPGSIRER